MCTLTTFTCTLLFHCYSLYDNICVNSNRYSEFVLLPNIFPIEICGIYWHFSRFKSIRWKCMQLIQDMHLNSIFYCGLRYMASSRLMVSPVWCLANNLQGSAKEACLGLWKTLISRISDTASIKNLLISKHLNENSGDIFIGVFYACRHSQTVTHGLCTCFNWLHLLHK